MSNQSSFVNVANYDHLWTGIAVMPDNQIFVNFPRWSANVPVSVARLELPDPLPKSLDDRVSSNHVIPFPNPEWNNWKGGDPVQNRFVCVQSVVADRKGYLWVLDSGNPEFKGVVPGAPRLFKFDPRRNSQPLSQITYAEPVIRHDSYLNDVRIDTTRGMAYLTDSETGAIIVTDLRSGSSRRLLDDHPSVKAESIDEIVIDDTRWRPPGGRRVHSDGIALSPENTTLYFHALMGRTLYRVATAALRDPALTLEELGNKVEKVGEETGCADGIECAPDGTLYLTSLEDNAVRRLLPNGRTEIVVQDDRLQWPDSLAVAPDGFIYVTTSCIHLWEEPYSVFRFKP